MFNLLTAITEYPHWQHRYGRLIAQSRRTRIIDRLHLEPILRRRQQAAHGVARRIGQRGGDGRESRSIPLINRKSRLVVAVVGPVQGDMAG